ncbi:hypothetical protein [Serratia nevei]|uniref:hypothetical protein n=1 Tax=Serratia nevei TaxID=2703794 RepID=UPI00368B72FB
MKQTLTTERLKDLTFHRSKLILPASHEEAAVMARELLANREAQPVGFYTTVSGRKGVIWHNGAPEDDTAIYTAPPAPAVPGIDELRLAFERAERESDDGFNLHKYGIGYADEATQARWESWLSCRAAMLNHVGDANEKAESKCECSSIDYSENCLRAMLAQPVSQRYTLPDGFKLMPLEMTDEIGEAIAMEARCCGGIALCIYEAALAAAPESGNG